MAPNVLSKSFIDSTDSMYRFLLAMCPSEGSEMGCLPRARDAHRVCTYQEKPLLITGDYLILQKIFKKQRRKGDCSFSACTSRARRRPAPSPAESQLKELPTSAGRHNPPSRPKHCLLRADSFDSIVTCSCFVLSGLISALKTPLRSTLRLSKKLCRYFPLSPESGDFFAAPAFAFRLTLLKSSSSHHAVYVLPVISMGPKTTSQMNSKYTENTDFCSGSCTG